MVLLAQLEEHFLNVSLFTLPLTSLNALKCKLEA